MADDAPPRAVLLFEGFRLDLGRACLLAPGGTELGLRPKAFDVLRHLVENAGRLVPRDELMEAVWPDVFVTDDSITQCVAEVRRALGDGAQRLLRTVPRRGYLFAAEVGRGEPPLPPPVPAGRQRDGAPAPIGGEPVAVPTGAPGTAERRHLTVLCCDLVDSTALSARLDPEELQELLAGYRRRVAEAIRNEDGHVAGCMGDGVFAYFGWPRAHEDDAERAIRAALAATAALDTGAGPLAARVGIATGLVVVGDPVGEGETRGRDAIGEAPNLAARLQALAEPGGVVLDAATRRIAGSLFDYADMGEAVLKGFAAPVRAWRALGEAAVGSRFEALRGMDGSNAAVLVGREEEMELLLRRWRQAAGGEGRVVLLSGEPGIGKSRLVAALSDTLAAEGAPHQRLSWYCSPQHGGSVLHPVIAWLWRAAGFARSDAPEDRSAKLEALLAPDDPPPEDVALLAELLGVPVGVRHLAPPDLSPQRRRERTRAALLRRVEALSRRRPVLAVMEDAHWADPSTRELLDLLVACVEGLRVLLVVTHRPEFQPPWVGQAHVATAALSRLGRRESAALLAGIAGGKTLPPEVEKEILARTDGVPLFVEEVAKAVLEGGVLRKEADRWVLQGPLPPPAVPATLQASLLARLDPPGPAMEVAQVGAAIGREFPYELLAAVARRPEAELREGLDRLLDAALVHARGAPPDAVYLFKHALVRDAAYSTLLRPRRRALHADIARALADRFPESAEARPELLAHHWAQAGTPERAVRCWIEAAELALARSALAEAEAAPRRALELLPGIADEAERARLEIDLQLLLARRHMAAKGYATPEAGIALNRALALCERAADDDRRYRALAARWIYEQVSGQPRSAFAAGGRLLGDAERRGDASGTLIGHYGCGVSLLSLGRFVEARTHLEAAMPLSDRPDAAGYALAPGHSVVAGARVYLAAALLMLGEPARAWAMAEEAVAAARQRGHPFTLAFILCAHARLRLRARDDAPARGLLQEAQEIADAKGFALLHTIRVHAGLLLSRGGRPWEGAEAIRAGVDAHLRIGGRWQLPMFFTYLAEALAAAGMREEATRVVEDGLRLSEGNEDRDCAAELLRLRGCLRGGCLREQASDQLSMEADLQAALALARRQRAKLWELRAAVDLARLWHDQGRSVEARGLLAPVYGWFTEGFDLPDLRAAKALLDRLR